MVADDFFHKHISEKTELKVFITGDPVRTTMLSGRIFDFDSETILLNKCLIFRDKIMSITPV